MHQRAMRSLGVTGLLLASLLLTACGDSGSSGTKADSTPTASRR